MANEQVSEMDLVAIEQCYSPPFCADQAMARDAVKNLLDLPEELILLILSYLDMEDLVLGVRQACKRLHILSRAPCLWRSVILWLTYSSDHSDSSELEALSLATLRQKCLSFKTAYREGDDCSSAEISEVLMEVDENDAGLLVETDLKSVVRSLEEVYVDMFTGTSKHSIIRGALYPNLQRLSLECHLVPDTSFLAQHTDLRHLAIESKCIQDDHGLGAPCKRKIKRLFQHLPLCEKLTSFSLKIDEVDEPLRSMKALWGPVKEYFLSGPGLTHVHIEIPLSDEIVRVILDHLPQLESLQLSNTKLTTRALKNAMNKSNQFLKELKLMGCLLTNQDVIYAICRSFKQLEKLHLTIHTTREDLHNWSYVVDTLLSSHVFPELITLELDARDVTSLIGIQKKLSTVTVDTKDIAPCVERPALPSIAKEGKLQVLVLRSVFDEFRLNYQRAISLQPHLKTLDLERTAIQCLSDDFFQILAMTCRRLIHVNIKGCYVSIAGLCRLKMLPNLSELACSVYQTDRPSRQCLKADLKKTQESKLSHLEMDPWMDVSCPDLWTLTALCPGLTSLTITGFLQMTDDHIHIILRELRCLKTLSLDGDTTSQKALTDASFEHLLQYGTHVRSVTWIIPCRFSGFDSLARVLVHCPEIALLRFFAADCFENSQVEEEANPSFEKPISITVHKELENLVGRKPLQITARHGALESRGQQNMLMSGPVDVKVMEFEIRPRRILDPNGRSCFVWVNYTDFLQDIDDEDSYEIESDEEDSDESESSSYDSEEWETEEEDFSSEEEND